MAEGALAASGAPADERPTSRRWPLALAGLRIVAEAGWITVLYAAVAVLIGRRAPVIGPLELAGLVTAGALVARWGRRHAELGPALLIVAVVVGGGLGWLASADARSLLPNVPSALGVHVAGLLGGLAVLRGALVTVGPRAAGQLESMIRTVPPALGIIWAYTTVVARPEMWLPFAVAAMLGTIAFLSAGLVGVGIARLEDLHAEIADARTRQAWRWLVIAIGFGIVPIAIPIGVLSGIPLSALFNPVVGPIQWLLGLLAIPLSWIIWLASELLRPVAGPLGQLLGQLANRFGSGSPLGAETDPSPIGTLVGLGLLIITIFVVLLAIFMFARWLLTRKQLTADEVDPAAEDVEREIVMPAPVAKAAAQVRRQRRRGLPHDVVAAYVAAVAELDRDPSYARRPSETPAQHAARVQVAAMKAAPDLARLAVGYQLARYGERRISVLENLRALGRFRRIKRAVRS